MEGIPDVFFIIIRNIGTVNVAEDVLLVLRPVVICQPVGDFFDEVRKIVSGTDTEPVSQGICYGLLMLRPELEQIGCAAVGTDSGIADIEHILDFRIISGGVDEGNTPSASLDIPPHLIVPDFVAGAGCGIRALGVDHKLLMVRVLVELCHGLQERSPVLMTLNQIGSGLISHFTIDLEFVWQW